ncbi:hypothetical protein BDW67DRAFT_171595 [Aspergillus spinulosporus]
MFTEMGAFRLTSPRRLILGGAGFIVLILIFLTHPHHFLSEPGNNVWSRPARQQASGREDPQIGAPLSFLAEYSLKVSEPSFCSERFGLPYLENLRDSATQYCTTASKSDLTCFHSKTASDRVDTFCLGRHAGFDRASGKFLLQCELLDDLSLKSQFPIPRFDQFQRYWYETGPKVIFTKWVGLNRHAPEDALGDAPSESHSFSILVKREMAHNLWHSLMEIFSVAMSIDVLRIAPQPGDNQVNRSFLSEAELANMQIVVLDDIEDGPFFELWSLLSNKPPIRLKELSENTVHHNIVVPLAGGSNPFWQGDWSIHSCEDSALLRTFSRRVLDFYSIPAFEVRQGPKIVLTFIDRTSTRRLVDSGTYLAELRSRYTHLIVQSHDFSTITLKEQLEIIRKTDILVGVHGAGLTHSFFLPPRSTMVEILPPKLNHKGFRNVASLMDLSYFSAHGDEGPTRKRGWQEEDVFIDKERFMTLMDTAIKTMYNRGERNYDTV